MPAMSMAILSSYAPSSVTSVEQTDIRNKQGQGSSPNTFASVAFGEPGPQVWNVAIFHQYDVTNEPFVSGVTIGGVPALQYGDHTGNGSGQATGIRIARNQSGVSSGSVSFTWGSASRPALSLVMLRVVGFDLTTPHDAAQLPDVQQNGTGKTLNIDTIAGGLLIGGAIKRNTNNITWTNLTEQGEDTQGSHRRSWGWDHPTALQSNRAVSFTSTGSTLLSIALQSFPKY